MVFVVILIVINILITFKTTIDKMKDGYWNDMLRNFFISFTLFIILIVLYKIGGLK